MDNLFTWLIVIGIIVSMINKASGKNNGKPGVNPQNRPNQNQPNQNRPNQNRPNQNQPPNSLPKLMEELRQIAQNAQAVQTAKPMVKPTPNTVLTPTKGNNSTMSGELVIPEGQNFGEGFADEEGTSFGDGLKGTEGECDEEHGTIEYQEETPKGLGAENASWSLSGENLVTAFVYSEVLGAPKCRRQALR